MEKRQDMVHPINKNFRYFIWTLVGVFMFVALASAYVYITDEKIDMDNSPINNLTDPTNPQDAATKAYVDSNGGGKSIFHLSSYQGFWAVIATTYYAPIEGWFAYGDLPDDEAQAQTLIPINGTLSDFRVNLAVNSLSSDNAYISLRKNGVVVLTFTYTPKQIGTKTNTTTISVSEGDLLAWHFYSLTDNAGGYAAEVKASMSFIES